MKNRILCVAVVALGSLFAAAPAPATERSQIAERFKWDLADLYADEAAWVAAKQALEQEIPRLARWQGQLGESAASLLGALNDWETTRLQADRLYSYAQQLGDQDTRVARSQQMRQQAAQVYTDLQTATAFMRPELLTVGRPAIERLYARQKG